MSRIASLAIGICLSAVESRAQGDIGQIQGIQASQITQNVQQNCSVPLISGKSAHLSAAFQTDGTDVSDVDAILHEYRDGVEVPSSPVFSLNGPFTAKANPSLNIDGDTLDFPVPDVTSGPRTFQLELTGPPDVAGTVFDVGCNPTQFSTGNGIVTRYIGIRYQAGDLPDSALMAGAAAMFNAVGPIGAGGHDYDLAAATPAVVNYDINGGGAVDRLLNELEDTLLVLPDNPNFLFGVFRGNPCSCNGASSPSGGVAFGNTDPDRYLRTFAHEMGHLFGQGHNSAQIGVRGADIDDVLQLGVYKSPFLYDIMVPDLLTAQTWIRPLTATALAGIVVCGFGVVPLQGHPPLSLWVTGSILRRAATDRSGTPEEGRFHAAYLANRVVDPCTAPVPEGYSMVGVDGAGRTLFERPFAVNFASNGSSEVTSTSFAVPVPDDRSIVHLVLTKNGQPIGRLDRSGHAPRGRLSIPPGSRLSGDVKVLWEGSDADGDALKHTLLFCEGPERCVPLAVDAGPGELILDTRRLRKTRNPGAFLRLSTTDRFNNTFEDIPVSIGR